MRCSYCSGKCHTKESRLAKFEGGPAVRRRRQCLSCGRRVTTLEVVEAATGALDQKIKAALRAAREARAAIDNLLGSVQRNQGEET